MTIPDQIEANTEVIRSFNRKFDYMKIRLDTSNQLLISMLDSWEAIFENDPSRYSMEDCYLYITSMRFLGKPGIVDKVEEHMNSLTV